MPKRSRNKRGFKATCRKCGKILSYYHYAIKGVSLCTRCNLNRLDEVRCPEPARYFQPQIEANYMLNTEYRAQSKSIYQNNSITEVWTRQIYETPSKQRKDFNAQKAESFVHPSQLNGTWRNMYSRVPLPNYNYNEEGSRLVNHPIAARCVENIFIHEPALSRPPLRSYYAPNMEPNSSDYSNVGLKRKREPDDVTPKRMRPNVAANNQHISVPLFEQLNENIWNHFWENCQTNEIFEQKMNLRRTIENIIKDRFPDSDLFVFGSSMTGFGTKTSDVDMCLMFHEKQILRKTSKNLLFGINAHFKNFKFLKKRQVIPAKVPILKFEDSISGFEIDLNICNPTGIRNSQLLRSYARLDERVGPLVLAVKFWARYHNINDAKLNTLSSYSLCLMIIHYLQYRCHPPVLPSLQTLQPDKYIPNADVRGLRINEELPIYKSVNKENVGQLFAGFIQYYSKEYDYKNNRISVRLGCLLPRVEKALNKEKELRYWIDIEEPFERTSVARSANNRRISAYIKSVFDDSCKLLSRYGDVDLFT